MNDQKQQLIDKIKGAKNVLVTVSANPSVDQLSAAIGLTLILNKLEKHATAVYSGNTPSTIEFLKPAETLEKNTDSLRDFIISLDKAKADKLRYKVEERVVKIFITPYRTSLTANDLEFSQGDFNVDVVIALGVHYQQDLDAAITAHGRILHDAVVTTVNNTPDGDLGSINWLDPTASSLSEEVASFTADLGPNLLDDQISTALLTGIVAETGRFRNTKTTPRTMSLAAELMAAGANQQLVANELEEVTEPVLATPAQPVGLSVVAPVTDQPVVPEAPKSNDGTLEIEHEESEKPPEIPELPEPQAQAQPEPPVQDDNLPHIGDVKAGGDATTDGLVKTNEPDTTGEPDFPKFVTEPPTMGGVLTANSRPEVLEPSVDPLSAKTTDAPLLSRDNPQYDNGTPKLSPDLNALDDTYNEPEQINTPIQSAEPSLATLLDSSAVSSTPQPPADPLPPVDAQPALTEPIAPPVPQPPLDPQSFDHETLDQIEAQVRHDDPAMAAGPADVSDARQAVEDAINALPLAGDTSPILALNAQPFGEDLHGPASTDQQPLVDPSAPLTTAAAPDPFAQVMMPPAAPLNQQFTMPLPPTINLPQADSTSPTASPTADPSAPPPVPPPMMPPGFVNPNQ